MSFTSARGKKIEVSEDALKKVQKLFDDDDDDGEDQISFGDKKRKQDEEFSRPDNVSFQKPFTPVSYRSSTEEQKHETSHESLNVIKTQPSNTGPFKTLSTKKSRGFVQPRRQETTTPGNTPTPPPLIPTGLAKKNLENKTTKTSLTDFVKYNPFCTRDHSQLLSFGLTSDVISITAQNAAEFTFQNDWTQPLFTSSSIGVVEITQALGNLGLNTKFCTLDWVTNHYKWIVWKLASMERSFPENFGGRYLTLARVLDQLKHRYEREVNQAHRSIIKKIVERDEVSTKFMILCVAKIMVPHVKDASSESDSNDQVITLELTDGWYGINALLDKTLTKHALLGRIFVGQKLRIFGAELSGSDVAASPLEIGNSVMLKLHVNGTRRSAWHQKLGLQKQQAFRINLKSVVPDGGMIPCVEVIVQRQYPLLFMETLADGSKVTRQIKDEEHAAQLHENQLSDAIAKRAEQQEKNWDIRNRLSQSASKKPGFNRPGFKAPRQLKVDINALETGEDLCNHMVETNTPRDVFMKKLSDVQQHQLQQFLDQKKQEDMLDSIQKITEEGNRVVVSLLKVKISDFIPQAHLLSKQAEAVLTIWRPSEDLPQLLMEGVRLKVYGVAPIKQARSGALTTTKYTRWKTLEKTDGVDVVFNPRQPLAADDLARLSVNCEFDYVGKIVFVSESQPIVGKTGTSWYTFKTFAVDASGELLQISMKSRREQKPLEGASLVIFNLLFKGRDEIYGIFQAVQLDHTQFCQSSSIKAFSQQLDEIQTWTKQNQHLLSQRRQYLIDLTQNNIALSVDVYARTKNTPTKFGSVSPFCALNWYTTTQAVHQIVFSNSTSSHETICERFHHQINLMEYLLDFDTGSTVSKIILEEAQFCSLLQGLSLLVPGLGLINGVSVPALLKYAIIIPATLDCSLEEVVSRQLCSFCGTTVATFVANKIFIQENDWNALLSGLSHWLCQLDLQVNFDSREDCRAREITIRSTRTLASTN